MIITGLDKEEVLVTASALRAAGFTHTADRILEDLAFKETPEYQNLVIFAREDYANITDDDIEVDDDAAISKSDAGTWVQAWVFVYNGRHEEINADESTDLIMC